MKTVIVWAVILLILVIIGLVKIGVHLLYEDKAFRAYLTVSRFQICLTEDKKTPKKKNKKNEHKAKESKPKAPKAKNKTKLLENPWLKSVLDYWQEIFGVIGRVLRSPTLDVLRIQLWVGGGDSEQCAMKYGKICAAMGALLPVVDNTFGIKKRQINVWCCFDRTSVDLSAETAITVRIYEILALVAALLNLGLKILLQARKYKKAVQNV